MIAFIFLPLVAVLAYVIFQGNGMGERAAQRVAAAQDEMRRIVGFSAADEIGKLVDLRRTGAISESEYNRLRNRVVLAPN